MRTSFLLWALAAVACAALAQTASTPQTKKTPTVPPKSSSQPPAKPSGDSAAVITIDGLCAKKTSGMPCRTVVTRAEFERLIKIVQPNLPPQRRMQLARTYAESLTFAVYAEQSGLAAEPEFQQELQQQLKLTRMRALATAYGKRLHDEASKITDADVEKYYNDNKDAYQEVSLKRIFIPKPAPMGAEKKPGLDEAATKELAETIRKRAAAGEDMDQLNREVSAAVHPDQEQYTPPAADMGPRRRGSLPAQQEAKIFELKPGQVTAALDEPTGYFIYKVDATRVLPFADVRSQISRQLEEQRFRDRVEKMRARVKATFDEQYFTPAEPPPALKPPTAEGTQPENAPKAGAPKAEAPPPTPSPK